MSSALKRALTPSSDINNVLEKALNIRSLQCSLGTVQQILNTEATTAEKRLRFVQTYGLDILETEKLNAESLNKLMATNLKDQIGPLQTFLSDMLSGDLFEGSASDRQSTLPGQIADAKNQAGAGVTGAADTLGTPYRNLISISKGVFGIAEAGYTADRATACSGAAWAIQAEQDCIN